MLNNLFIWTLALTISIEIFGQTKSFKDSAVVYFNEIKTATKQNKNLWNYDLYGPILFVQSDTRQLYANYPDSAGLLKKEGSIYMGILPQEVNIANTSLHWNGKDWAMVMLPLPDNKSDRLNLLAHELFHRAQPALGFKLHNTENNHLDQKDGRIYLRLELEALKSAVLASSPKEIKTHLTNAFIFRGYRYTLYPGADTMENLLELNEGIAEYTGITMSGRIIPEMQDHFVKSIREFLNNPTFVRSFAYQTTPIYGYLLRNTKKDWNKSITAQTNLTDYFLSVFNIQLPDDFKSAVTSIADQYDEQTIIAEETAREEKIKKLITEYKNKFIEQPHLDIRFENMNISFDPRNIMPIEDKGTVYPNIRVADNWGILTVGNGALLSPNWNKITVSTPTQIDDKKISGDGWTLELKNGYTVQKDSTSNNYFLRKK